MCPAPLVSQIGLAEKVLKECLSNLDFKRNTIPEKHKRQLEHILLESKHKTYRYICINGLLGKVAHNFNPMVLQKGSALERAWDARSVCHKVICGHEDLNRRLGGSNEPFLNKPARYKELSRENSVRGGKNKETLETLCSFFEHVDTLAQEEARNYLRCALAIATERKTIENQLSPIRSEASFSDIYSRLKTFLEENLEGQTLTLVTYAIFADFFDGSGFELRPHKVNQSGASHREHADLDVFEESSYYCGVEIKDKSFSQKDFSHAESKVTSSGGRFLLVTRMKYIGGFSSQEGGSVESAERLISIESLMELHRIFRSNGEPNLIRHLIACAEAIQVSDEVVERLKVIFEEREGFYR